MKTKFLLYTFLICVLASVAAAGPIEFCSDGLNEGNSRTGANVPVDENPAWQSASGDCHWVSYANTGGLGNVVSPPNTDLENPTAVFWETFNLTGPARGKLFVWADDTAGVDLGSGSSLISLAEPNPIQDDSCAAGALACEPHEGVEIDFYIPVAGAHTLYFPTYQRGNGPFALYYRGSLEQIPEPASFLLVAIGLGLTALSLRRVRQ